MAGNDNHQRARAALRERQQHLEDLAREINSAVGGFGTALATGTRYAITAGKLLNEAFVVVGQVWRQRRTLGLDSNCRPTKAKGLGGRIASRLKPCWTWEGWVPLNCQMSRKTADQYRHLADNEEQLKPYLDDPKLSKAKLLRLLSGSFQDPDVLFLSPAGAKDPDDPGSGGGGGYGPPNYPRHFDRYQLALKRLQASFRTHLNNWPPALVLWWGSAEPCAGDVDELLDPLDTIAYEADPFLKPWIAWQQQEQKQDDVGVYDDDDDATDAARQDFARAVWKGCMDRADLPPNMLKKLQELTKDAPWMTHADRQRLTALLKGPATRDDFARAAWDARKGCRLSPEMKRLLLKWTEGADWLTHHDKLSRWSLALSLLPPQGDDGPSADKPSYDFPGPDPDDDKSKQEIARAFNRRRQAATLPGAVKRKWAGG
jgi:hypothetical protein